MRKLALLFIALVLLVQAGFGLELKDGRMRLVVEERTGRFAIYYLSDVAKNRYTPFLYDQEMRTTYPTLMIDQKTYKLGDSSEFRVSVKTDDMGALRIEFRSAFCVVRQSFTFIASPGSTMSDGVAIDFSIENVSQTEASFGLRVLYDTWLGEKSSAHFSGSLAGPLSVETSLIDIQDQWIRSSEAGSSKEATTSLQLLLSSPATRPDRLIAANWKRLNDANWSFDTNAYRNYTLLPYSINDSALALYFDPSVLRPGAARSIRTILSQANDGYPVLADGASMSPSLSIRAPSESAPLDAMADLIVLRSVLDAINEAIGSGEKPDDQSMANLKKTLQLLETRKLKY
ncbi:MAG: hypothetical protein RBT62_03560 [Spirochaetia bacterium]|jgi:hypothetical protein|nr:hypothetical protein [Spirochaetia bacterium]